VFDSTESRAALKMVRRFLLDHVPPSMIDRAAFDLIDQRQDAIDRRITALRAEAAAAMARADPAPSPSMLFSFPYVLGMIVRERLKEIENNRGHA
jgi:hypothetical protein